MKIETENLSLVQCSKEILEAALEGNHRLAEILNCKVSDHWSEFGLEAFPYVLEKIAERPQEITWWTYFPIYKKDNQLIGSGGYKGGPTEFGTVEIGYEISPGYRNRGLATEMAIGLIHHAFCDDRVKSILAHTLAHKNPSTSVLRKCGFEKIEEINDPNDGLIWKWKLK